MGKTRAKVPHQTLNWEKVKVAQEAGGSRPVLR